MQTCVKEMLIGTAKLPAPLASEAAPVDELVGRLADLTPERRLLLRSAARAVCGAAGRRASAGASRLEAAPAETRPECSLRAGQLLGELFGDEYRKLLPEALARLSAAGLRLPPELLPEAMSLQDTKLRRGVAPVLGERGVWLSRQNPEWSWATTKSQKVKKSTSQEKTGGAGEDGAKAIAPEDEIARSRGGEELPADAADRWADGTAEERVGLLGRVRATDPALARQWLEEAWLQEKAEQRGKLLAMFAVGLSAADEAFLEARLGDRSAVVRRQAAELLMRIDGSAFGGRIFERADRMISYTQAKGGLKGALKKIAGGGSKGILKVEPPDESDDELLKTIGAEKPPAGVGPKAWALTQIVRLVPPARWVQRLAVLPGELISLAAADEWGTALIDGWTDAAVLHADDGWMRPLWDYWHGSPANKKIVTGQAAHTHEAKSKLLAALPPALAEEILHELLTEGFTGYLIFGEVLKLLNVSWSRRVAVAYLDRLRDQIRRPKQEGWVWESEMETAAAALPPECFAMALGPWPEFAGDERRRQSLAIKIESFTRVIHLRQRIAAEIPVGGDAPRPAGASEGS